MPVIDPMLEDTKPELQQDGTVGEQYPTQTVNGQGGAPSQSEAERPAASVAPAHRHPQAERPSMASAEELQLAAQLSQDLNHGDHPMQDVVQQAPNDHMENQEGDQIDSSLSAPTLPPQDGLADPPEQLIHQQHHGQMPQRPQYVPIQQPPPGQQHPHQNHIQHPQQQQLHRSIQHQLPHLQPHAVDHIAHHYAAHAAQSLSDNTPPRKRSKVSRACDECRRKKVKCDAGSETGEEPCSNCRRGQVTCLFSRIPQKRGPSKGYIKELADRIHHIEGKLASEGGNVDGLSELLNSARRESDLFGPSGQAEENSRKRPYSSMSDAETGTPSGARHEAWGSEPRPVQPYQTPSGGAKGTPYSADALAPRPLPKPDTETPSRPPAVMETGPLDLHDHNGPIRELNESAYSTYLNVVHPCFPLLASTKDRVEAQLAQCPTLLREAFFEALYGAMQSSVSSPGLYTSLDIGAASRMISDWESDVSPRTSAVNLVHLQSLILTAIATDNYGPLSLKGEHGGPSKASILGRAVGLAYSMRLYLSGHERTAEGEWDFDADENLAIRAWWTLVMLDRWNAIGTAGPLLIPQDSVVILPSLKPILGDSVFHLARLTNIMGHFAPVSLAPPLALQPESGALPILNSFFNLSVELLRQSFPSDIKPSTHPVLHLAYWHCRSLAYLFQTNSKSTDLLWALKESADLLLTNTGLLSPLNHHFFSLTALCLLQLAKVDDVRDEANPLLAELLDSALAPSTWDSVIIDLIAEHVRPSTAQIAANRGLQHLADLATADVDKSDKNANVGATEDFANMGFDPRSLIRRGYLSIIADGHSKTSQ